MENYFIEPLKYSEIERLARFIVNENYVHHKEGNFTLEENVSEIKSIYEEEILFFKNSNAYLAKDSNGNIIGSIRVFKWNSVDVLPMQKIFQINPLKLYTENIEDIWHIGRFAIKKEAQNIKLFKRLIACSVAPICENPKSIALAECDSKLVRTLSLLGINCIQLAPSIQYLGSETIPIKMPYAGLMNFYNKNKVLLPNLETF